MGTYYKHVENSLWYTSVFCKKLQYFLLKGNGKMATSILLVLPSGMGMLRREVATTLSLIKKRE